MKRVSDITNRKDMIRSQFIINVNSRKEFRRSARDDQGERSGRILILTSTHIAVLIAKEKWKSAFFFNTLIIALSIIENANPY